LFDIPTVDVDMAAHVVMERAAFPASAPSVAVVPTRAVAADKTPASRKSLAAGLMLAVRFIQARFISVWGLLVAAALCPPQAFADFAVFSAFANFVAIAALMRLEAIFFQSSDRERLGRAFRLALAAGMAFLGLVACVVIAGVWLGWIAPSVALLFLISLTGRSILRLLWSEATAEGDFRVIGNSNVVQAVVQPVLMLLLIWSLGANSRALFLADALGHAVAASYLIWLRRKALIVLVQPRLWSLGELLASAIRWRDAPRYLLPSALLSYGFSIAPLMALPYGGNPLLAAHVALAMRLLDVPTQMYATVSGPLVLNHLRALPEAERQAWVRLVTLGLMAGAAALFGGIALAALGVDALLDEGQWRGVGEIVAIMTLFYCGIALVSPLHDIATLSRHPLRHVATNAVALLAAMLTMLWFGALSMPLLYVLGLVSLARMLAQIRFTWTRLGPEASPLLKPEMSG
jgi:hypothetical protein